MQTFCQTKKVNHRNSMSPFTLALERLCWFFFLFLCTLHRSISFVQIWNESNGWQNKNMKLKHFTLRRWTKSTNEMCRISVSIHTCTVLTGLSKVNNHWNISGPFFLSRSHSRKFFPMHTTRVDDYWIKEKTIENFSNKMLLTKFFFV